MKAVQACIFWTPNRAPYEKYPTKGRVDVHQYPDDQGSIFHPMSVGACWIDWTETNDQGRWELAQRAVTIMLHDDKISIEVVSAAISQIDEYKTFPFSIEKPPN